MNASTIISALVTAFLLVLVGFSTLETYLLARNRSPITWYTRNLVTSYPHVAIPVLAVVAFVVGLFVAHFGWDQAL